MAFYRRRPRPDAEKCADPAKARAGCDLDRGAFPAELALDLGHEQRPGVLQVGRGDLQVQARQAPEHRRKAETGPVQGMLKASSAGLGDRSVCHRPKKCSWVDA